MPEFEFKPMSKGDLCRVFGITHTTLRVWLKPIADKLGVYETMYKPKQVKFIYSHLIGV